VSRFRWRAQLHGLITPQKDWLKPTIPAAFDHALGLQSSGNNDILIVAADVDTQESGRRERHRIESALVVRNPHALLRALQRLVTRLLPHSSGGS
jgi:hypothetical protein